MVHDACKMKISKKWTTRLQTKHLYFSFCTNFCPFIPLTVRKVKISKKMKKILGDISILHKCTKNHDNMLHCFWDMVHDACKIKISRKGTKRLQISSFYTSVPKIITICYTVPEIWCMTHAIFIFHFVLFFAL